MLDEWKPKVDASLEEMHTEIGAFRKTDESVERIRSEKTALRKTVSRAALESTVAAPTGVLPPPLAFTVPATAGGSFFSPIGTGIESSHRGKGVEPLFPVKGTQLHPHPFPPPKLHRSHSSSALVTGGLGVLVVIVASDMGVMAAASFVRPGRLTTRATKSPK